MAKSFKYGFEAAPGVFSITLPLPGKKPGPVNAYLFVGKNDVALLDTGTTKAFGVLKRALGELGLSLSDIDRIVLTHSHVDHYGAAKRISAGSGKELEITANFEKPVSLATGVGVSRSTVADFLAIMGVPVAMRNIMRVLSVVFSALGDTCEVATVVREGDIVQMGDYECMVIETPGHTIDSICLYHEPTGILFSGDHVLPHITPNAFVMLENGNPLPRRKSQKEFFRSIEKVRSLSPRKIYPAHGRMIEDFEAVARMYAASYTERDDLIVSMLKGSKAQTVYAIAMRLFPVLDKARLPLEIFLAVSEVYTHIQVLEEKGLVSVELADGALLVRAR